MQKDIIYQSNYMSLYHQTPAFVNTFFQKVGFFNDYCKNMHKKTGDL